MGQFSVEKPLLPGSALNGNQQLYPALFARGTSKFDRAAFSPQLTLYYNIASYRYPDANGTPLWANGSSDDLSLSLRRFWLRCRSATPPLNIRFPTLSWRKSRASRPEVDRRSRRARQRRRRVTPRRHRVSARRRSRPADSGSRALAAVGGTDQRRPARPPAAEDRREPIFARPRDDRGASARQ